MSELLRAESLHKSFGTVAAVKNINLDIKSGEIVAIMGRSGSGKSTAMHLLAGLERPSGGHVFYRGQDIAGLDEDALALWRRENIGLIFQAFHLIPTLSALENVAFPLYPDSVSTAERRQRAAARLEMVGLADRIVDVVDSGNTLKANGLVPLEHIADISSRLVVNKAARKVKHIPPPTSSRSTLGSSAS